MPQSIITIETQDEALVVPVPLLYHLQPSTTLKRDVPPAFPPSHTTNVPLSSQSLVSMKKLFPHHRFAAVYPPSLFPDS